MYHRRRYRRSAFPAYKRSALIRLRAGAVHKQWAKERGMLKCEVCNWHDPLTLPFFLIESHHIVQHCDGGSNGFENRLLVCPTCHRIADKISKANRNLHLTRSVLIALICAHEFERERKVK